MLMGEYRMAGITYETGDLEELRVKVGEWAARNFGSTLPKENTRLWGMMRCLSGMSEELSEFIEDSPGCTSTPTHLDKALDAIADICIYSLDFMFRAEMKVQDVLMRDKCPSRWERDSYVVDQPYPTIHEGLAVLIGKMHHHTRCSSKGIREHENHFEQLEICLCHVWRLCYRLCNLFGKKDLNVLVKEVAEEVLKRDWVKNPEDAHLKVDG